jgi:hypothetical protein
MAAFQYVPVCNPEDHGDVFSDRDQGLASSTILLLDRGGEVVFVHDVAVDSDY